MPQEESVRLNINQRYATGKDNQQMERRNMRLMGAALVLSVIAVGAVVALPPAALLARPTRLRARSLTSTSKQQGIKPFHNQHRQVVRSFNVMLRRGRVLSSRGKGRRVRFANGGAPGTRRETRAMVSSL